MGIKQAIPLRYRVLARSSLNRLQQPYRRSLAASLFKNPPMPLPSGMSENDVRELLSSMEVEEGIPPNERAAFLSHAKRFVYTLGLVPDTPGLRVLELGADPFLTTTLITLFRRQAQLSLANYADVPYGSEVVRKVLVQGEPYTYVFKAFNAETEPFPYADSSFDLVLFCEMLEHFPNDPVHTLIEIRRVLSPGGRLIISTPNAARLENVCKMIAGEPVMDQYSGYGVYGRHNREFTVPEVTRLLSQNGFTVDTSFTADIHEDWTPNFKHLRRLKGLLGRRGHDLGQYQFSRSYVTAESKRQPPVRPDWLYRSLDNSAQGAA